MCWNSPYLRIRQCLPRLGNCLHTNQSVMIDTLNVPTSLVTVKAKRKKHSHLRLSFGGIFFVMSLMNVYGWMEWQQNKLLCNYLLVHCKKLGIIFDEWNFRVILIHKSRKVSRFKTSSLCRYSPIWVMSICHDG